MYCDCRGDSPRVKGGGWGLAAHRDGGGWRGRASGCGPAAGWGLGLGTCAVGEKETALPNRHRGIVGVSRDLSRAPSASQATEQSSAPDRSRPTVGGGSGARFARLLARWACGAATPAGVGLPLVVRVPGDADDGGRGLGERVSHPTLISAAFGLLPLGVDVASAGHGSAGAGRCFSRPWVMAVTTLRVNTIKNFLSVACRGFGPARSVFLCPVGPSVAAAS
jgi:hypothetical protein